MSGPLREMPDHLAESLASGEVVERPASVVKELVENSLDAGATRISIAVRNGGKAEIRVSDDGHGMGREEALLALEPFTTSKVDEAADLASVRTLGFRGSALPAIASVSRMHVETAEREGDGTRLIVSGGKVSAVESCERHVGTTVVVRSLFFNAPVRAKSLRSPAAELRALTEVLTTLAVAHPHVAFELRSDGAELLRLQAAPELRTRVADVWGEQFAAGLLPVVHRVGEASLTGLVQGPRGAGNDARHCQLFVNGRAFSDRRLLRSADRAYQSAVSPGSRPSYFLFLDLPEGAVDVNVNPPKTELRFRDPASVEELIAGGVQAALRSVEGTSGEGGMDNPAAESTDGRGVRAAPSGARTEPHAGRPRDPAPQMSLFVASVEEPGGNRDPDDPEVEAAQRGQATMWQVHDTYLFVETRGGLLILDQHSAHERVLFDETMRSGNDHQPVTQRLLFPITLRVSPAEYVKVEELSSLFARIGFEIELFGGRTIVLHAVPQPHPHFDAERCLREMIRELTEGSELVDTVHNQHHRVALSFACHGAIRSGQPLSQVEMTELFDRLFATESPYHDIHGRPTVVQLSLAELHNRFGR